MRRREFLQTAAVAAGMAMGPRAVAGERPNVVLFICDQMREPAWFGGAGLPNFERLKQRGVAWSNHFVSAVPCSPSRACLMTGRHMDAHGVFNNMRGRGRERQDSLDPTLPTLGTMFKAAGYRTPYFGKWHLSRGKQQDRPDGLAAYGFDYFFPERGGGAMPGTTKDPEVVRAALDYLAAGGREPFFLTLSVINPHDICGYPRERLADAQAPRVIDEVPANLHDDLGGKPRCQLQYRRLVDSAAGTIRLDDEPAWRRYLDYYHAYCLRTDHLLGQTLDALQQQRRLDDTLFIFTSDHGELGGSHGLRLKGPCVYRENLNVPLIFSWPGRLPAGERTEALSQNVDLFPTLAGIIGESGRFPRLAGRDLQPVLAEPARAPGDDHALFSFTNNINLDLIARTVTHTPITAPQQIRAIRTRDRVYARYFGPASSAEEYEFYDLRSDPLELRNLAGDPSHRAEEAELARRLAEAEATEMK
jgi:arylsulfatase A-like enzyme